MDCEALSRNLIRINVPIPTNQNNFEQDLLRKSAERNNYEQRPNSRNINMSTPFIGQNSIIPSSPLYQTSELPQQRQSHPSQRDSQRQPQKPKKRIGTSTKPKNNRQSPTFQVTKKTLSPILTKVLNSVRHLQMPHQTHSKVVLEQQMLDNFSTHFTQMGSTLRYTTDMFNTVQSSILDAAQTYKKILRAFQEFNSAQKFASNSSSSSNRTEEVSQLPEERHIEVTASTSSTVVTNANAEPGSSRQEQSIIAQDNQTMESAQTGTTGSDSNGTSSSSQRKHENLQELLPIQEQQELSRPYINVATPDTPTLVIDDDEEVQSTSIEEQQLHVNENHLNQFDNMLQTDEWMEEETPSAHHGANSDSDTITDHEVTSDHEMSADEAPVERTNNFYGPGISSENSFADRPIAAQNSTIHPTHSKVVLEQQMLDNFATLFTQMGSTLRYTTDMYHNLRSVIPDIAETYKKLLGAVEEYNSAPKLASNSSSSSNQTEEVSQLPEERHIEVTASTSSSTQNQHSRGDANRTPKTKHNSWRVVLPPEYDPRDSKWTLKYQTNLPGLVELQPQSGVYISYGDLKYCQQVSKDCKSLAKRLLLVVFNRNALSVCLSMTERVQGSGRPELDDNACTLLLNFVLVHGLQRGWNTDLQPILNTLHSKIQEIRFKYGVMVQC